MNRVLVVARAVLREARRRRLILAIFMLTIGVVALTGWGFSRVPTFQNRGAPIGDAQVKLISSQLLILVAFMFSRVLALGAVFVAAPAISGEIESGLALALLARPIARAEYLLGKWIGLAVLIALYSVVAIGAELVAVSLATGYAPPDPLAFTAYTIGEAVVMLTFALALSTRLTGMIGGVVALVLSGAAWIAGVAGSVGGAFDNLLLVRIGTVSGLLLPTDGLWRGSLYALQPPAIVAIARSAGPAGAGNPFLALEPPTPAYLVWSVLWVAAVLGIAIWSFRAREI